MFLEEKEEKSEGVEEKEEPIEEEPLEEEKEEPTEERPAEKKPWWKFW